MMLKGNPVSPGVALGKACRYEAFACEVTENTIPAGHEAAEKARLDAAVEKAAKELDGLHAILRETAPDKAKIFSAHKEILYDEEILEMTAELIVVEQRAADYAVCAAFQEFISLLGKAKDPLIAARVADLRDVRNRLVRVLRGLPEKNLSVLREPVIVVAHDLLPSDTATLDREKVLGIITEVGGATSHSAIIANSYGIPAVLGVPGAMEALPEGAMLGLDALEGGIYVEPGPEIAATLKEKREKLLKRRAIEEKYRCLPAQMADGWQLETGINIGSADGSQAYGWADFVGLFRTEFLYMQSDHAPTEEEQFIAYRRVLTHAKGKAVILRTLDIGGDKTLSYMKLPKEENPFLGKRALRLCMANPELFKCQLRAALRASAHGPLWLMLPMVGSMEDIRAGRSALEKAKAELRAESVPFDEDMKFGIMIEIPAIAMIADRVAEEVDFASIGTNDLTQYLCAVDRMNAEITEYYQPFAPSMVRVLDFIIRQFHAKGKPISVCGEMGGDPLGALLLAGLGLKKLSMSESKLATVKAALHKVKLADAREAAEAAKYMDSEKEVLGLLRALLPEE